MKTLTKFKNVRITPAELEKIKALRAVYGIDFASEVRQLINKLYTTVANESPEN
jgi:hypothetical protein